MSRSALVRQEASQKERERHASSTFTRLLTEGDDVERSRSGIIPLVVKEGGGGAGTPFNLNPMLIANISRSPYFVSKCAELMDWSEVVDEIYYTVEHVLPWTSG
mmetsp:Transcript_12519/g.27645  ORF Transcript_12519/g.27645 Transcript_12519/m.27645 type:complete len:104 (+) Transcript_12519:71-382(+)